MGGDDKMAKWQKIKRDEGTLYFQQHKTKKHGVKYDRYYRTEYQHNKKRIALNFGWASEGWTESACLQKLKFFKGNAKKGIRPINFKEEKEIEKEIQERKKKQERKNITFSNFFNEKYCPLIEKQKTPATVHRESSIFLHWIEPVIGDMKFPNIKKNDIDTIFHSVVDAGRTIRTAEYTIGTAQQIFREAGEEGLVNTFPGVSKPIRNQINRNDNSRTRFLSYNEADLLLDELKKVSITVYEQTVISLHCGLRAGEILGLTWGQVDISQEFFNLKNTKSGKNRSIKMTDMVLDIFAEKKSKKPDDLVFPGRQGKQSVAISSTFKKVADKIFNQGVSDTREKVTFHTCRYTCASWLVMEGVSLYLVQKVLGHSTIQVTERYSHLAPDQLQVAADAINNSVRQEGKIIPFPKKA